MFFGVAFLGCSVDLGGSGCNLQESISQNRSIKRGVAFNFDLLDDISVLGKELQGHIIGYLIKDLSMTMLLEKIRWSFVLWLGTIFLKIF